MFPSILNFKIFLIETSFQFTIIQIHIAISNVNTILWLTFGLACDMDGCNSNMDGGIGC